MTGANSPMVSGMVSATKRYTRRSGAFGRGGLGLSATICYANRASRVHALAQVLDLAIGDAQHFRTSPAESREHTEANGRSLAPWPGGLGQRGHPVGGNCQLRLRPGQTLHPDKQGVFAITCQTIRPGTRLEAAGGTYGLFADLQLETFEDLAHIIFDGRHADGEGAGHFLTGQALCHPARDLPQGGVQARPGRCARVPRLCTPRPLV